MADAESVRAFIELHLQPHSGRQTDAHRAQLVSRLVQRMPEVCNACEEAEAMKSFHDVLDVVCELRDEQQPEPLAALARATRCMPGSASELRKKISVHVQTAWQQSTIDPSACIEIHAYLAQSIVSADLFNERLLNARADGDLQPTADCRVEPAGQPAEPFPVITNSDVAGEMEEVLHVMLENVRAMSDELQLDWFMNVMRATSCVSYFPTIATRLSGAMLEIAREMPGKQQLEPLIALAETGGFLWYWLGVLESAQLIWGQTAIEDSDYADILAALERSATVVQRQLLLPVATTRFAGF